MFFFWKKRKLPIFKAFDILDSLFSEFNELDYKTLKMVFAEEYIPSSYMYAAIEEYVRRGILRKIPNGVEKVTK